MTAIMFFLGPKDGEILEHTEPLPPSIIFPMLPDNPTYAIDPRGEERIILEQLKYERIGDTANYICVNPPNL